MNPNKEQVQEFLDYLEQFSQNCSLCEATGLTTKRKVIYDDIPLCADCFTELNEINKELENLNNENRT